MINLIEPITVQQAYVELLTNGNDHHEIDDGGKLVMMMERIPLSGAPNRLQISPPDEEQEAVRLGIVKHDESFKYGVVSALLIQG